MTDERRRPRTADARPVPHECRRRCRPAGPWSAGPGASSGASGASSSSSSPWSSWPSLPSWSGPPSRSTPRPRPTLGFGTAARHGDLRRFQARKAPGQRSRTCSADLLARAPLRAGRRHSERDRQRPRLHPDLPAAVPGPARALWRADAVNFSRAVTRPAPEQVAVTPGLASELNLRVGDTWPQGGKTVVGIVAESPEPAGRVRAGPARAGGAPDPDDASSSMPRRRQDPLGSNVTTPPPSPTATSSTRRPSCWRWRRSACC